MEYRKNKEILSEFYVRHGLAEYFEHDSAYLESAFDATTRIWVDNFCKIDKVKYLMIAEAPLWGKSKSYIYNPAIPPLQPHPFWLGICRRGITDQPHLR